MKPVAQQIREISFQLLKETFDGPAPQGASAFLNKGTGLLQTLAEIGGCSLQTPPRLPPFSSGLAGGLTYTCA